MARKPSPIPPAARVVDVPVHVELVYFDGAGVPIIVPEVVLRPDSAGKATIAVRLSRDLLVNLIAMIDDEPRAAAGA
jgi:hypothetical protein